MTQTIFSERQKAVVAAALTSLSLVAMVALGTWMMLAVLRFFAFFSNVFMPLAVAAILATLMKPLHRRLSAATGYPVVATALTLAALALPVIFTSFYFGAMLLSQLASLLQEIPVWASNVAAWIRIKAPVLQELAEQHGLRERAATLLEEQASMMAGAVGSMVQSMLTTGSAFFRSLAGLAGWLVLPVYVAFLLQAPTMTGKDIERLLPFLRPETKTSVVYLATEFAGIMVSFFRGQLIIALLQGLLFAVGFTLVGLPHGMVLGLILGLLNIVPYLGNMIGVAVLIPLAWFHPEGGTGLLVAVAVVFTLVQVIEGYVLTPRIMGQTTGLHPMAIIVAILFWGAALDGLLGMILAIPLTAFLVVFWRLLKTRYIKEWI